MNWTKLLYVLIIVLLYIPMVFVGANVFFPEYTGQNAYYQGPYADCYAKYPYPVQPTQEQSQAISEKQMACQDEFNVAQREFEQEKLAYEARKYIFITIFNLAILLFALFVTLQDSVTMGLFLGAAATTFGATLRYFDTKSKIGFAILVLTFFAIIYFINKKKDTFVDWKTKNDK